MMKQPALGNIFIISAASGTGKTTLVSRLLQTHDDIRVSISHTTRAPRQGEENGKHYYFTDTAEFERLIGEGAFLEHAEVYGHYYGTSAAAVGELQQQGYDVILEIDVQGAQQIRRALPDAVSIFILPPDMETLTKRLHHRATDSESVIEGRLKQARSEIEQSLLFDYIVVNDDLIQAQADLWYIIRAARLKQSRQTAAIRRLLNR